MWWAPWSPWQGWERPLWSFCPVPWLNSGILSGKVCSGPRDTDMAANRKLINMESSRLKNSRHSLRLAPNYWFTLLTKRWLISPSGYIGASKARWIKKIFYRNSYRKDIFERTLGSFFYKVCWCLAREYCLRQLELCRGSITATPYYP